MKRFKIILIFLLLSTALFAEEARVNANSLNIRESPSPKSKVIAKLKKGDVIRVYSCAVNDFCNINYGSVTGYVSGKYLVPISTQTTSYKKQENTNTQQIETQKAVKAEEEVGSGWKIGIILFLLVSICAAILGFVKKNTIVAAIGTAISLLFIIGLFSYGLTGFILLIQKILICTAIFLIVAGALYIYASDANTGSKNSNHNSSSSQKPKYINIVRAYVTRGCDLCVEIENQDGRKKTFRTTYGGGVKLEGYTNSSVTIVCSKHRITRRLKGDTLFYAELFDESQGTAF